MHRLLPLVMFVTGCAQFQDVDSSIPVLTMQAQPPVASRAATDLSLRAVSFQDLDANKGLLVKLSWNARSEGQASRAMAGSNEVRSGLVPVLPLPAFAVHVGNHSNQPLDFTKAAFALVDDKGKRWPLYQDLGELTGRVWGDILIRYPALDGQSQDQDAISDIVLKEPLLDRRSVIAPNADFDGYLVFKLDARIPEELEKYLASVQKLTVEITNVGPDNASFTVPITQGKGTMLVTCPGNKPQSIGACHQRPFAP
jgi:hypothetical protein